MKNSIPIQQITLAILIPVFMLVHCQQKRSNSSSNQYHTISKADLLDKIKGAWAAQTIGVTYGGPTEFRYNKRIIPDSVQIHWSDSMMYEYMVNSPGLYDDIYMDLTFVDVMNREGIEAPASSHANAYANAKYWLWHANQQGRYNILNGLMPPESGHWLNNPHADDIDFQIEADFAGIMSPGMPNTALDICDRVGHIMNYGDGYYGGVFMATMYSYAFVDDDIESIVRQALSHIPKESTFYQCISDVLDWQQQHPDDWKTNWHKIEQKWGNDIGCPDGVMRDFNIDAKINAAYVVLGLLYGDGELGRTMEISTRAGQDSDCNPASSGAIIGTILGYQNLPDYWADGLVLIEDMDFQFTTISLNDAYDISFKHALELIEKNGGIVEENQVMIKKQGPKTAPLEQNFPGYTLNDRKSLGKRLVLGGAQEFEVDFEGIGIVLTGRVKNTKYESKYALLSDEETMDRFALEVDYYIDDEFIKNMVLPLYFIERAHEPFYKYQLSPGKHTLKMVVKNPRENVYLQIDDLITYSKTD
jgi:hypothetical protein